MCVRGGEGGAQELSCEGRARGCTSCWCAGESSWLLAGGVVVLVVMLPSHPVRVFVKELAGGLNG